MATHSSILAWKVPWTEEPGGYSPWGCTELAMTERLTYPLNHDKTMYDLLPAPHLFSGFSSLIPTQLSQWLLSPPWVDHSFFPQSSLLPLLSTWDNFHMAGFSCVQVSSWLMSLVRLDDSFESMGCEQNKCYYLMPKVVNVPPALSRPYVKMVRSQFGGPAISWSPMSN